MAKDKRDNLISPQELNSRRSPEQHSEDSRKGGKASGAARRERKLIRDRILERMGESDWDEMIDGMIKRAKEDTKSFETLRDTIGEKPKDRVELSGMESEQSKLSELLEQRKARQEAADEGRS